MLHHLGDVPQGLMKLITKSVGLFLLIALFFILQYLFNMDFLCSCRPGPHDVVFVAAPPLLLTSIVTLIESIYQMGIFCRCCKYCVNNFCTSFVKFLMKYLFLTAVWVSTVLFDGDWYFCLKSSQTGIPCKKNLTYEETLIEASYKNESRDWGFAVISGMFLLWNAVDFLKAFIRWCQSSSVSGRNLCCPPYYKWVYEDLLSEAVSSHIKKELKIIAEKRAKKLCDKHVRIIYNHELQEQYPDGSNANIPNANADENPNGNHNDNPNGNLNGNPNDYANGNSSGNLNENPNDNANKNRKGNLNGNVNGNVNGNLNGNPNETPNGNLNVNPNGNANENPNGNANGNVNPNGNPNENPNGNDEQDNIFDTWQNISLSYFYLLDEGVVQINP
ncbi:uncharacterized protein LOC116043895 [Sander lucioperca]|uniref:uncharacterized protein LOC116043895 n=1 Tax=Sander lucioperca TaxID=283035 RepID=UPI00125D76E1|nr:uncharacterized protein LOC116043895 [Sander lucioperca]